MLGPEKVIDLLRLFSYRIFIYECFTVDLKKINVCGVFQGQYNHIDFHLLCLVPIVGGCSIWVHGYFICSIISIRSGKIKEFL